MDRRTITVMALMLAFFLGYQVWLAKQWEKHPEWKRSGDETKQPASSPATQAAAGKPATLATTTTAPIAIEATQPATRAVAGASEPPAKLVAKAPAPGARLQGAKLGSPSKGSPYVIEVEVQSLGAAISAVTLNQFTDSVGKPDPYVFQRPYKTQSDKSRAFATRSVNVEGYSDTLDLTEANWTLESTTTQPAAGEQSATYLVTIGDTVGRDLLEIRKIFRVKPEPAKKEGQGYEITIEHQIKNIKGAPIKRVVLKYNGPSVPKPETRVPSEVVIGQRAGDNSRTVELKQHYPFTDFSEKQKSKDLRTGADFLWAGITTAYFDAIVLPNPPEGTPSEPKGELVLNAATAEALNPGSEAEDREVALTFEAGLKKDVTLEDGKVVSQPVSIYLGPKQREILNSAHFTDYPRGYEKTLVLSGGMCAFCTSTTLINALVWLLVAFHTALRDWGLAIIALVALVRTVLHPITKRSQVSMSKMTKMGPEMERIKKKYADQPDELKRAQAELMKEQGMTPVLGCLPMLLQMPIWIALWSSLQSTFELRQEPFLWGLTWIKDLSQPDFLVKFAEPHKLIFSWTVSGINLLPILMAVVFWVQQKMTPKPVAANKEQEQQQKMMQWMSLLFPVFLYNGPSGLNLYILTSTTIGIFESKIIRDHIKKKEEEEKAGKVIVDAPQTRAGKRMAADKKEEPKKKGGIGGWLADLQAKAEDMAKRSDKKRK